MQLGGLIAEVGLRPSEVPQPGSGIRGRACSAPD